VFHKDPSGRAGLIHGGVPAAPRTEECHSEHHTSPKQYRYFFISIE